MSDSEPVASSSSTAAIQNLTKKFRHLGRLPSSWVKALDDRNVPAESYLCDTCSRLDLKVESFLVQPDDNKYQEAHKFRYLGRLSQIRRRTHCPFCRLVLQIADRPPDQRTPSLHADDDPVCYAKWVVDGQEDLGPDPNRPGEHIYQPKTRRLLIYSDPQAFKDGYLVLLADDAPSREFFGRRISSPDLLDPDLIRQWIRDCETTHGNDCEESLVHPDLLGQPKNVFRVVDVEQMCIVETPQTSRYVALSYLWGKNFAQLFTTSKNLPRLSQPGALEKEKLPRTIKDAIRLTKMLGERFLWTDSLALMHDDGFQYHDDWVYARAALTVVAGSGKDANAGLPGVRKESRKFHQEIEEVVPGLRLMVSHLAEDYISTSQWDSRAWTFQERMLSRRCLLFVNGRIYYQCRRTTFCEDMEMPRSNGWSLDSIDMPTRIFKEKPFVQFTSAVELYTRRELTNPNDILNAFEGVQLVLEKRIGAKIYYGALETMMDSSLIWESTKRLYRRPGFPSWSWSGWIGEVQWKYTEPAQSWIEWHADQDVGIHPFPRQEYARIPPPLPRPENRRPVSRHNLSTSFPLLHFRTVTAVFQLTSPALIHKSVISPLRKRLTGPSALSTVRPAPADPGLIRAGLADRNGLWCGTIDLNVDWMPRAGAPFEFLIMSRVSHFTDDELAIWEGTLPDDIEDMLSRREYGVYNVMLVSRKDGIYYREGLGRILTEALHRALEAGPEWKEIVLG
ncbi:hypothetical protein HRR83_007269 [Exophiala dermatitidis]|uniref:Heterokaryon incompatibility domain-containing protein n=2 Tax=Exophiala dermatitidis TaxID=5970 RepID=H6C400_EXODN|nr:uncharacterized protein HMPREF1120_06377 [Exophiala dermatitidis NIH/UT8656]KAJ4509056.1 hypothetical protein HRR75_006025 [Exophiala dermatitidis]EHY58365.1 hypothetical protein HMPREF1120_06377 [Exophiala dermatitidis NIH/UT8656]KAJ4511227.1 hypothetical protein HRR73_006560 [Exophiala dermatitidis]KAJ4511837.1 hypothetical protein HRR74_006571 [Exophiala dermatitidis]KAJ4534693.1 hypothetical protein HRR76_006607 [Exophiala dermatitidis]